MKHIKRKFLHTHNITNDGYEFMVEQMAKSEGKTITVDNKMVPHIITTNKEFIQGFFYKVENLKIPIPEPNPIIIYFSNAQGFLSSILEFKQKLVIDISSQTYNTGDVLNNMFAFYGCVVNFTSSLFDALEAFVNSKIPKDFKFTNPNRRGKMINKYEIIRYQNFDYKVKIILPEIFAGKNFVVAKSHLYAEIKLLNKLRDNITHAKSDLDYEVNYYEKLFTEALDFDYVKAIESAKSFINFYEDNLIEPCNCGKDH